jgi:hypothetical protein
MAKRKTKKRVARVTKSFAINQKTGKLKKGYRFVKGGGAVRVTKGTYSCSNAGRNLKVRRSSRAGAILASKRCK